MSGDTAWEIVFYIDENGRSPAQEFLESLDTKTQIRFEWSMEQLRIRNLQAGEPLVKHIDGKIWELRRTSSGNTYRLMYFFFTGRRIVFLHGFQKKTQKTPRKELTIAQKRLERFLERGGE